VFRQTWTTEPDENAWVDITPGSTARNYHHLTLRGGRWFVGGFRTPTAGKTSATLTSGDWSGMPVGSSPYYGELVDSTDTELWALRTYDAGTEPATLYRKVWCTTTMDGSTWSAASAFNVIERDAYFRSRPVFAATGASTFIAPCNRAGDSGSLPADLGVYTFTGSAGAITPTTRLGVIEAFEADNGALPWNYPTYIAIDPSDTDVIYVAFDAVNVDVIYRSVNGGASWENVSSGYPIGAVRMMRVHPDTGDLWVSGMHGNWILPGPVPVGSLTEASTVSGPVTVGYADVIDQPTVLQTASSQGGVSPAAITLTDTTVGSTLIAVVRASSTVTVGAPAGWTEGGAYSPSNPQLKVFYRTATGDGSDNFSATLSGAGQWNVQVIEATGIAAAPSDTENSTSSGEVASPVDVTRAGTTSAGLVVIAAATNVGSNPTMEGCAVSALDGNGVYGLASQAGMGSAVYSMVAYRVQTDAVGAGEVSARLSWTNADTYQVNAMALIWPLSSAPFQATVLANVNVFGSATVHQAMPASSTTSINTFGILAVHQIVDVVAITPTNALGTVDSHQDVSVNALVNATSFGSVIVNQTIPITVITSDVTIPIPTVVGTIVRSADAITHSNTLGVPTVHQTVEITAVTSSGAFGVASIGQIIATDGVIASHTLPEPIVHQQVSVVGVVNSTVFGTHDLDVSGVVEPTGVANTNTVGTPTIHQTVPVMGLDNENTVGAPAFNQQISVTGTSSSNTFGTAIIGLGVSVIGGPSVNAIGTVLIHQSLPIGGVVGSNVFGLPYIPDDQTENFFFFFLAGY
jgi:hypothetical protein